MRLRMISLFLALVAVLFVGSVALAGVGVIGASEIQQLLAKESAGVMLLDVRTSGEFARGHMPGSVLIPMRQVPGQLLAIPRNKKVVVVCATGARSGAVARFLIEQGYPWVRNYSGGMSDWAGRGLPVIR